MARGHGFCAVVAGFLALTTVGCSAGGSRPAPGRSVAGSTTGSHASASPPHCSGQEASAHALTLTASDGSSFAGLEFGAGPKGVLLVPEAGRLGKCGWVSYATELAAKGLHVITFDMPSSVSSSVSSSGTDLAPGFGDAGVNVIDIVLDELRSKGATTVVLVGASAGATTALAAVESQAVGSAPGVTSVVALSADELGDLPSKASSIHVPTLMAVADGDRYIAVADERRLFDALATPPAIKTLEVLPAGSGHGWDLLADQAFKDRVTAFITTQLATGYTVWGTGPRTIVLSNQSDENQDAWQPYADHLVAEGYRVVMWDYATNDPVSALSDLVQTLRTQQAGPIFLVGASRGGKTSLVAAADITPPVTAVVTLSAEAVLASGIDVSPYVKRLTCPVLLLTAEQDAYGSASAAKTFQADLPTLARTVTYPGSDHGTALLSGTNGAKTVADIDAFLKAH
jgi:dienelactone hydrolase